MCGIYGLIDLELRDLPFSPLLARMGGIIEHRGPDDSGQYVGRGVGLGMRRLSIIDVSGGHQPISNEDETVWLVLNGEIYNFQELRLRLEKNGHRFRTKTDTETIVHLYEEEGAGFLKRLRGMFGLALWDAKQERLVLARDRVGEKPLYVKREPNRLLFASELKSILEADPAPRKLNFLALQEFLALGYVPAPLTLLEGIEKLLPGHCLIIEKGRIRDEEYWDCPAGPVEHRSEGEWIELVREKIVEAVKMQLVSDVPLGAFLSGGIDSSTIVATMARLTGRPVKTYSIGYDGDQTYYNELPDAKVVAQAFATDHHEIIVRPNVSELLPELVWHLDEPIADSACLTTYLVSRLARESVTVILSGVGGDELFGGYRRYLGNSVNRWFQLLPGPIRRSWIPGLLKRIPQDRGSAWKDYARYAAAFTRTADQDPATRYMSYVTLFSRQMQQELLAGDKRAPSTGNSAESALAAYFCRGSSEDGLNQTMYVDLKTSLPDDLLALTDRMSMAASIECRAPLVDYELVELAARMPSRLKVRGFEMKYLLKKVVAPWVPRRVIERKKRGFGAPVGGWLRRDLKPLMDELLSEQAVHRRALFSWPAVESLITAHQEERSDHTDHLFGLVALELWCRCYLDGGNGSAERPSAGGLAAISQVVS